LTPISSEKGYHSGLEILSPPEDDDWWDGNFTHFDFEKTFNKIAGSVPKTMADKSFEPVKWVTKCSNENEPTEWNECKLTFYSEVFVGFLQDKGRR
jgi:hypothetical protein